MKFEIVRDMVLEEAVKAIEDYGSGHSEYAHAIELIRAIKSPDGQDGERFRWLLSQSSSVQDAVLRPPIAPELLEFPDRWEEVVRVEIDKRRFG